MILIIFIEISLSFLVFWDVRHALFQQAVLDAEKGESLAKMHVFFELFEDLFVEMICM